MSRIKFQFTSEFQNQMLALMLEDPGFALKVTKYIPSDKLYSDSHIYLYEQIKKKLAKNNASLSWIEYDDELKHLEKAKRAVLKNYGKIVFSIKPENPEYIKEKVTEFAKRDAFVDIFATSQVFWNSEKFEQAFEYMMAGINDLYAIDFKDDAIVPVEKFEDERQIFIAKNVTQVKQIPTGITALDQVLRGGLSKGELAILLAEPKKGKSIGLLHMGVAATMTKFGRVAHFVLEGTTEQTILRYISRFTGIEYGRLEKDEITPEEQKKIDRIKESYIKQLDLIPFNKHWSYTVPDIEAKLRELTVGGRKPDLVVVDYADLLKSTQKYDSHRHEQTEVYRDLKRLAIMYNVAIWTASQAQRPKDDVQKREIRAKDIAESYEKVRIADMVCSLNQTPIEKTFGILRLYIDIYRSSEGDIKIPLLTNFEKMIFHSKRYGTLTSRDESHEWMQEKKSGKKS